MGLLQALSYPAALLGHALVHEAPFGSISKGVGVRLEGSGFRVKVSSLL